MSCSKVLLSKKGVLGTVWVAAVSGVAALSRDQVVRTNVVACVDKILPDDNDKTTYRVLGLLLLGIVRIYSKKVEYLCHECNELLGSYGSAHCNELSIPTGGATNRVSKQAKKPVRARRLVVRQEGAYKVKIPMQAVRTTRAETRATSQITEVRDTHATPDLPTFTIPKRFELDSFDLGIPEDRDDDDVDHHQLPHQENEGELRFISLRKNKPPIQPRAHEPFTHLQTAPHKSYKMMTCSYADLDSACIMPVRVILPPEMVDMMAEVNDPSDKSTRGKKPQRELNRDENGNSACHIPLSGSKEVQIPENIVENVTFPSRDANCPTIEESENGSLHGTNTNPSCDGFEEPGSLEQPTLRCKTKLINELSPSTPEPMTEGGTGLPCSPKFMVTTPAKKEKHRVTRKRRRGLYNKDYIPTDRGDKRKDTHMDEQHARDEGLLRSTRTRTVARYFHQLLVDQKCQQRNNSVCLGQALEGTKRKTSARFFYETLILKSGSLIEVNQEQTYGDIIVSATPRLEAALRSSEKQ
ncbi:hypothetical protein OsI_16399 [Oryza sativa Indica Group]|uniref:Rad21/Rec8-like protein N-terminal domain-containing protein n=1 Tax=Oryza sativa subsp. indica TaxID=39946 RepID=B8AVT9_ORYSI|nr:hypothetical protein OsI_16399 [Oryza sativa Indica Group]